jgi:hypothetical protein
MEKLIGEGVEEIAVYGVGCVAKILYILSKEMPFKISNMYDKAMAGETFLNYEVLASEVLKGYEGKVVIASLVRIIEKGAELEELGIDQKDIVRLQ